MKFVLMLLGVSLVTSAAFADEIFALRGPQLAQYGIREDGPRIARMYGGGPAKWKKQGNGYACVEANEGGQVACFIVIDVPRSLVVNEFAMTLAGPNVGDTAIETRSYDLHATVTQQEVDAFKTQVEPSLGAKLATSLYNVRNSVILVDKGACYVEELRFLANTKTKLISNYWFEKIAAHCP